MVWQSYVDDHWQTLSKEFMDGSLNNIISNTDDT
jgi:hypothetical protein